MSNSPELFNQINIFIKKNQNYNDILNRPYYKTLHIYLYLFYYKIYKQMDFKTHPIGWNILTTSQACHRPWLLYDLEI